MTGTAYRVPNRIRWSRATKVEVKKDYRVFIERDDRSSLSSPRPKRGIKSDQGDEYSLEVRGHAWAGDDKVDFKVEVSVDFGATWIRWPNCSEPVNPLRLAERFKAKANPARGRLL